MMKLLRVALATLLISSPTFADEPTENFEKFEKSVYGLNSVKFHHSYRDCIGYAGIVRVFTGSCFSHVGVIYNAVTRLEEVSAEELGANASDANRARITKIFKLSQSIRTKIENSSTQTRKQLAVSIHSEATQIFDLGDKVVRGLE